MPAAAGAPAGGNHQPLQQQLLGNGDAAPDVAVEGEGGADAALDGDGAGGAAAQDVQEQLVAGGTQTLHTQDADGAAAPADDPADMGTDTIATGVDATNHVDSNADTGNDAAAPHMAAVGAARGAAIPAPGPVGAGQQPTRRSMRDKTAPQSRDLDEEFKAYAMTMLGVKGSNKNSSASKGNSKDKHQAKKAKK